MNASQAKCTPTWTEHYLGYAFAIYEAATMEDLDQIALDIDNDKHENMEYTKHPEFMRKLRAAWGEKRKELQSMSG